MDCSVIILSYNTKQITDTCLSKLERSAKYCEKQLKNKITIVVVDNDSRDGSVEMIKAKHPTVVLHALKENVGYAKGNNLAMADAKTPYILLINSDTYLYEDTLCKTLKYVSDNPMRSVLCVRQLVKEDAPFEAYGGHFPTPFKTLRWLTGVESVPGIRNLISRIYMYDLDFYKDGAVMEWCPTSCFLLTKQVYEKTGGFDEHLFLFMEDVEWCKRIRDAGYKIYYYPGATAIHLVSASTKKLKSREVIQRQIDGMKYYQNRHHPLTAWIINPLVTAALTIKFLLQ